jgi:hypothetical protein
MEMYFLCKAESYRLVKTFGVTGTVRPRDQYDHRTGISKVPVWLQDLYVQGLEWSQEHCDKGRIWDKGTSMITEPVSIVGMIIGAVWSTDIINGPVWLQDRDDQSASMFTTSVWSQEREELVLKNHKIPQKLLGLLFSVGCPIAAVWILKQLYSTLWAAFQLWKTNLTSQMVAGICFWWSSRHPELDDILYWSVACIDRLRSTTVRSGTLERPPQHSVKHPYTACDSQYGARHSDGEAASSFRRKK